MKKIIKINEVMEITQLSRASIYQLSACGQFPRQIKLGLRSSGWLANEVQDFIQQKMENRYCKTNKECVK